MIKYIYDPQSDLSYGTWRCPKCGSMFYGGGKALHYTGCAEKDYSNCEYLYTANEIHAAVLAHIRYGESFDQAYEAMKQDHPEILAEIEMREP